VDCTHCSTPLLSSSAWQHTQTSSGGGTSAQQYDTHVLVVQVVVPLQEIGLAHMRISDGVGSRLQLSGLLARLCKLSSKVRKN
jgi:hypothetical protein